MTAGSVIQSSWRSFIGRGPSHLLSTAGRGRDNYTLRQRFWASFIGLNLPPTRGGTAPTHKTPIVVPHQSPQGGRLQHQAHTGPVAPGRFLLPRLPQVGGLTAAGGDAVLLEASSPDGRATFLVRGPGATQPEYSLELVLRGTDAIGPLMTAVGYTGPDGTEQLLLVPLAHGRFGPPASYVRLPNFDAAAALSASVPVPVSPVSTWDATMVAVSVRAALNEATRDAWRQVRELVADDGLRAVIDGELL